jgi:hypothetical protein
MTVAKIKKSYLKYVKKLKNYSGRQLLKAIASVDSILVPTPGGDVSGYTC